MSTLRERLESGQFVITTEMEPPKGTDLSHFLSTAALLKGKVDAINVTDNQRAIMRLSSVGGAALLVREGLEPILQLTCRDRNRMALQSDLLTASVLGVRNVLAMTGDPVFFCGATVNPCVEPLGPELKRFEERVAAGARFVQTQAIYDLEAFARFIAIARKLPVYIIAGLIPLRSVRMAHFLNEKVPGIHVPPAMIERLDKAADPIECGLAIAAELVEALRQLCQGIHLMIVGKEKDFAILERLSPKNDAKGI